MLNFRKRFTFSIKKGSYCSRPATSLDVGRYQNVKLFLKKLILALAFIGTDLV